MINVTIKTLDSLNRDFSVPDDYTVQQLKDHIADAVQMPAESQRLIYLGRVLQNETKLSEADVNGKVIHLVERAPPQMYQQYDTIGQNASVNQTRYLHEPRRNETGPGTMYLGAMAFPADLMESQGIAIPQPRQGLTTSRIFIARTMLRRAQTVISRLENTIGSLPRISGFSEFDTFLDRRPVPDSSTSTQNTFETASTSDQPDIEMQMDESEDASNGTSEMAGLETGLDLRNWTDGNGLHIVIGPNFRNAESINIPPVPPNNAENMETETPNTSDETRRNERFRNRNTNENGDGNRGITCTSSMAGVLGMMVRTQRRLWPYLRAVEHILAEDMPLNDQTPITAVQAQTIFNSVSEVMHDLSHAFHALSDIMCNFSAQPPRSLRCRPVLIQHSAVVHTGMIPGNRIANINLRNYLRPRDTESTTTTTNSNAGISSTTPTVVTASGSSNSSSIPADEITVSHPRISIAHAGADSNEIPAIVIEEEVEISRSDAENGNAALPGYVVELPSLIQIDSVEATIVTSSSDPTRPTTVTSTGPIHVGQTLPSNVIQNMISMVNDHLRRRQSSSATTEATPTGTVNQPQTESNLTNGAQTSNSQTESVRMSTGSSRTTEASNSSSNNNQTSNDSRTSDSSRISDAGRISANSQTTEVNGTSENNQTTTENTQTTDSGGRTSSENQAGNTSHSERSRPREQHIFIQRPRGTRSNFMPTYTYSPSLGREQRRFQSNSRVRRLPLPTGFDFSGIGRAYDPFLPCNSHHIQSRSSNSTTSRNSRSTNTDANMAGTDNIVNANGNTATATVNTESESRENSSTVNGENSSASGATEQAAAASSDASAERTDGQPPSPPQATNPSVTNSTFNPSGPTAFSDPQANSIFNVLAQSAFQAAPFQSYPQFSSRPPYSGFRMVPSRDIPYFFGQTPQTASRNSTSANTSSNRTNQSSTPSNGTSSQDRSSSSSPEANIERSAENLAAAFAAAAVGILQTTFNLDEAPRVAVIQRNDNEPRTNGTTEQQSTNINNNVSDRNENADENEDFPMTVTQPISLGAPLFDENLGSFFMDFVNSILRGLPFSQIMELHTSDIQRLSLNFRKLFRQYLIYHFFPDGFEKCLATEVVNKLFNNHIVTFRQILDSPDIRADIDLVSTICRFNHMNIPDLLACVMSHDNDEVFALRFPRMMRLYLGQLATLVKSCLINNNDNLKKIMLSLVDKCAEELPDDPVMLSWLRENLPQHMISYESRPIAELPGFMKDYIVFRLPDPVDLPDLAEEVSSQSFMMEIEDLDRDVSMKGVVEDGNENKENKMGNEQNGLCQDSSENGNVNSAEQFQNLLIEPEGWHNSVPAEWVPIITRDVQKLRRQGSQPPFSDAYLTGMPSKRRRLLPEHKSDVDRTSDDTVLSDNSHSLRNSGLDEPKK